MEPDRGRDVHEPVRNLNWTIIALVGALVLLLVIVIYFSTRGNANQDKLSNPQVAAGEAPAREKLCASKATYDLIKRDLFRRAGQVRGSDQAAYDQLSSYAVLRMENPVMESEDSSTGAISCSGSLSIDLPPGVAVVGGRRTLSADVDYTVQQAADGSGTVILLRNVDAIVTPLATLSRVAQPSQETMVPTLNDTGRAEPMTQAPGISSAEPQPPTVSPPTPRPAGARPSFDCTRAQTKGEIAVCSNAGLAALDRNMAAQYSRSIAGATPEQQVLLKRTRDRFLAYRDRCPNNACIGDAYVGRMREIRDIMEGRWRPR